MDFLGKALFDLFSKHMRGLSHNQIYRSSSNDKTELTAIRMQVAGTVHVQGLSSWSF